MHQNTIFIRAILHQNTIFCDELLHQNTIFEIFTNHSSVFIENLILTISNTLLMMLIILMPIIKDSATVNILEDCPIADKMPDDACKVNKGNSDVVD